jgi:hypothetical protein
MYILSGSGNMSTTYLGIGVHHLAWGETRDITIESQRRFVPLRFGAPMSSAGIDLLMITVAGEDLLFAPIPMELLSGVSTFPQMRWPEIGPGRPVTFTVRAPLEPPRAIPLRLRWWRRLLNWILRRKQPEALPLPLPCFTGAFYGALL